MQRWMTLAFVLVCWAGLDFPKADACEDDIENAKTPLTLPELLPEGGIAAVDFDYWMLTRSKKDGKPWGSESVTHYTIKADGDRLVFKNVKQSIGATTYRRVTTTVYTGQGKLVSYEYIYAPRGKKSMQYTGKVENDEFVIEAKRFDSEGNVTNVDRSKTLSLEPYETSLPVEWQPLVFAYHIRQGSLGYRLDRTDISRSNTQDQNQFEDVGIEQVQFNGKTLNAHLLIGNRTSERERRSRQPASLQYLVLTTGELMSTRFSIAEYEYISIRFSEEDFNLMFPFSKDE